MRRADELRAEQVTLMDGRGARHTPWATDPAGLHEYTVPVVSMGEA